MARGVNKVILVGNLGADPETRSMPSGMTVTNIRIATSESWKDKASGAQQERTEWHSIALFGRLGEIAAEYLRKGSQVFVEGKLRTRKWQDKQGNDRYTTEIIADNMQMLGARGGGGGGGGMSGGGAERGGSSAPPRDDYDQSPAPAGRPRSGGGHDDVRNIFLTHGISGDNRRTDIAGGGQIRGVVLNPDSDSVSRPTVSMGAGEQLPGVVMSQVWIGAGLSMNPAST